jgi:hypothetical protein
MRKAVLLIVTVCALVAASGSAASVSPYQPVHLTFDKQAIGTGVWQGTVAGDVNGALTTRLLSLKVVGPIWLVTFDWIVDSGPQSFTARLSGILNTNTGSVVMTGKVISGFRLGASVIEQGQLMDPVASEFAGTIDVMPNGR